MEEKLTFLGLERFVKFTNTEDFPELSTDLRTFLQTTGVYSYEKAYPYLTCDGRLRRRNDHLVEFGRSFIGTSYCIDTRDHEKIKAYREGEFSITVNTSLGKYIECLYVLKYFSKEYEVKEKLGNYWENRNYINYAAKLKELLEEVETNIVDFEVWYVQVYERELGVI